MLSIVLGYKRINDISRQQIKRAYTVVRLDNRPLFRKVRYKERDRTQESDENLANTVACTVQLQSTTKRSENGDYIEKTQ